MNACTAASDGGICLRLDDEHTRALKTLLDNQPHLDPETERLLDNVTELVKNPEV